MFRLRYDFSLGKISGLGPKYPDLAGSGSASLDPPMDRFTIPHLSAQFKCSLFQSSIIKPGFRARFFLVYGCSNCIALSENNFCEAFVYICRIFRSRVFIKIPKKYHKVQ